MLFRHDKGFDPSSQANNADRTQSAIEFAWRAHSAQEAWAGKVDTKASIILALESGALFAALSANATGGLLSRLSRLPLILEMSGVVLIFLAILISAASIYPRLGSKRVHGAQYDQNTVHFGHLRYWNPGDLQQKLAYLNADDELAILSRQLVEMSKINWQKHMLVRTSLALGILGATCIVALIFV